MNNKLKTRDMAHDNVVNEQILKVLNGDWKPINQISREAELDADVLLDALAALLDSARIDQMLGTKDCCDSELWYRIGTGQRTAIKKLPVIRLASLEAVLAIARASHDEELAEISDSIVDDMRFNDVDTIDLASLLQLIAFHINEINVD